MQKDVAKLDYEDLAGPGQHGRQVYSRLQSATQCDFHSVSAAPPDRNHCGEQIQK